LARDCTEQQRCTVLLRKLAESTDLKEVKILVENNEILITPVSQYDDLRVFVNGREYSINELVQYIPKELHNVPVKVHREGAEIQIQLLNCGITVRFDGQRCTIERSSRRSIHLCGLCSSTSSRVFSTKYNPFENLYNQRDSLFDQQCNEFDCPRQSQFQEDLCHISRSTVKSFDNVERQLPLSTSFKVLARDCSEQQRCTVLLRKLAESTDLKEVKILVENNEILITPVSQYDDLKVFVNGREYSINELVQYVQKALHNVPVKVHREGAEIKIHLLNCGITVHFDGQRCTIERSSRRSIRLCGLCDITSSNIHSNKYNQYDNLYNQQSSLYDQECNEFDCPRQSQFEDDFERSFSQDSEKVPSFWQSLFQHDDLLEVPSKLRSLKQKRNDYWGQSRRRSFWGLDKEPEHETFNFWNQHSQPESHYRGLDREWENVNEYEQKRLITPILKHKLLEIDNKICISLERLPQCPLHCDEVQKVERRVSYTCLHRNDPEVRHLVSRVRSGESIKSIVQRLTPSTIRAEIVPLKCTKLF